MIDDHIDAQRGDADVPAEARRVRRYTCMCPGCGSAPPYGYRHDDGFFPVYGPPTPHEPRRAAA